MKKILFFILLLALLYSAWGHECILLSYHYKVKRDDTLELHLFIADGFNVQIELPFQKVKTKKFELFTSTSVTDLLPKLNDKELPVLKRKVDFDGNGLFAMERNYSTIALPHNDFLAYLKEDHIENIKVKKNAADKPQRERYTRLIKLLVQSGKPGSDTIYKRRIGQAFEIVLLKNPYLLHKGDVLQAQVFFMNKPLANKIMTARNRTGGENTLSFTSRTNDKGICSFRLIRKGEWFIHATQMIPCPDKTDSDWESFWASHSFEVE